MQTIFKVILSLLFLACVGFYVNSQFGSIEGAGLLLVAAMIGGYMAMNIGANDVANNVGPAVGSMALTMGGAIILAAVFESGGALIAGGEVVKTVKKGIIDTGAIDSDQVYIWVMMAALLGAAIWLNIATALGAPVSTTHSIVGGVMGAGIAAQGWGLVNWTSMGAIASSWVISPVLGGLIAALLLYFIKHQILFKKDVLVSAGRIVPVLIGLMGWAFGTYLALKGLKHIVKIPFWQALLIGLGLAIVLVAIVRPRVQRKIAVLEHNQDSVNELFTWPLIFGAALLSFAHGANDVANAIGPLAGIFDALSSHAVSGKVQIPLWIMLIGAFGIALGLALYGPKLIRTVGSEITELDRTRAFCIALSAAVTVIIASQLGLPVSSTHVALGAVFGVGFLREYLDSRLSVTIERVIVNHAGTDSFMLENTLHQFYDASPEDKDKILKELKKWGKKGVLTKPESKQLRQMFKRKLVKRQIFGKIIAAWLITVPLSAGLSAVFYFALRGALLP